MQKFQLKLYLESEDITFNIVTGKREDQSETTTEEKHGFFDRLFGGNDNSDDNNSQSEENRTTYYHGNWLPDPHIPLLLTAGLPNFHSSHNIDILLPEPPA